MSTVSSQQSSIFVSAVAIYYLARYVLFQLSSFITFFYNFLSGQVSTHMYFSFACQVVKHAALNSAIYLHEIPSDTRKTESLSAESREAYGLPL